ncbi:hypothetical protein L210DRAFT_3644421 [Boletus edulis BED1]|uniref:Uncharacterized protein n=1 Tax=Boletus edulis BED1 TaxID=1328754 RepID=A0AAD4BY07_BOLED|nr:hypothetical protein L210DRAFT_3644421 [Boletus edulis BED1]
MRARKRARALKKAFAARGKANMMSFAAQETNMLPDMFFEIVTGDAATIKGAVQAFRNHHWVYLARHGAQGAEKPFESR